MLLNYVEHANPTGIKDVLDKIRAFAVSQGWVQEEWLQNKRWYQNSPYGWVDSENGDYLCLSSSGYGNQNLIAKLELNMHKTNMGPAIAVNMCSSKDYTLQLLWPHRQNVRVDLFGTRSDSTEFYGWSLPASQMERLWIFGDEKWICAIVNIDGTYFTLMHFGSFQIFDTASSEGDVTGRSMIYGSGPKDWNEYASGDKVPCGLFNQWGQYCSTNSFAHYQRPFGMWYGGRDITPPGAFGSINAAIGGTLFETNVYGGAAHTLILPYRYALVRNVFSGRRVLLKQLYFHLRSGDSVWEPICQSPCYFCNFEGLSPGELLVYGDEEYLVFPVGPYITDRGIAFRVA